MTAPQDEGIEHGDSRILSIIIILPLAFNMFNGSSSSWVDFRGVESDMWMYPKLGGGNSNMFYFQPENWGNDPI